MCLFSVISTAVVAVVVLHQSYVSQKTILAVTVSNPCVCGQLGVTGISTHVTGRGRVAILNYFVTYYKYFLLHHPFLRYVSYV
jgi:hypothetical protein